MRIGIIGIGNMGHGIAATLVGLGHPLVFLERPGNAWAAELAAAGARPMGSIGSVTAASDVVLMCVTGTPEVEEVVLGPGGVLESLRPGMILVDHSTAIPSSTVRVAAAVSARGGRFLDAPMTGTPSDAASGRINLLVGGDEALFDEIRPLLGSYAQRVVHAGPVGAGHQLKLVHNFVSISFAAVLSEAVACAERAGIDKALFVDVLANGGGRSTMLERLRPYIEARDTTAYRFSIGNAAKDLGYYVTLAEELGASRVTAEAVSRVYADAVSAGHGGETVAVLVSILAGEA
ncbi:MAG: NAD(P)-dependent oxidoreductase [Candidatus Limnocylindrales bacterium]